MTLRLKIQFRLAGILMLLISFQTQASITRTRTMGDVGIIIHDNANFWLFPSRIIQYPNQILIEAGGKSELIANLPSNYGFEKWAGGIVQLSSTRSRTFGLLLSENNSNQPFEIYNNTTQTNRHQFSLFYGYQEGLTAIGFHLGHASANHTYRPNAGTSKKNASQQSTFDLGFSTKSLDLTMGYRFTLSQYSGDDISGHRIHSLFRYFKPIHAKLTFVPLANFIIGFETVDNKNVQDVNAHFWQFLLGAGLNYQLGDNDLLAFGLNFSRKSQTQETGNESSISNIVWDAPFFFGGFESALFRWLKVRFGFQKALRYHIQQAESAGSTYVRDSYSEAPFVYTVGVGFQVKRITIDLSWDSNFLRRGPYFASGSKGDIFNLISIAYDFQQ